MKKSKAVLAEEQQKQQMEMLHAALRWSDDTDLLPDVPPPSIMYPPELTTGWVFNTYTRTVEVACSSAISHTVGQTDRVRSQGPRSLYSTRIRALLALRSALEHEFAAALAKIDALIEQQESV